MTDQVSIAGGGLHATLSSLGAELVRLHSDTGLELLWNGDPAVWSGRSPLLFPIVGNVKHDTARIDGKEYTLVRHGFARTSTFTLVEAGTSRCTWRLLPNADTRARYPFEFRLDVTYTLDDDGLAIRATVVNETDRPMPASFGFHPGFRWPIVPGTPREAYDIRFERPEPAPIRRLAPDELMAPGSIPSPLTGDRLMLTDTLFSHGALIFDQLQSRRVSFGASTGPRIEVDFPDMPHLGIWTKPGAHAGYVCIEPWQGYVSPADFDGEMRDKPGMLVLAPRARREFGIRISVR
jgi:galactose mutarotase-like enzyme